MIETFLETGVFLAVITLVVFLYRGFKTAAVPTEILTFTRAGAKRLEKGCYITVGENHYVVLEILDDTHALVEHRGIFRAGD